MKRLIFLYRIKEKRYVKRKKMMIYHIVKKYRVFWQKIQSLCQKNRTIEIEHVSNKLNFELKGGDKRTIKTVLHDHFFYKFSFLCFHLFFFIN